MAYKKTKEGFYTIEHQADIGLAIFARSLENFFEFAAEGMFSIICDIAGIEQRLKKVVRINEGHGMAPCDLLVLWLEKLLYIHETGSMLFSGFKIKKLEIKSGSVRLEALALGERIDFKKHTLHTSVKAPTYHKLEVSRDTESGLWSGQIIFDV